MDTSHIKEADLSLIQINARLEARLEQRQWVARFWMTYSLGVTFGLLLGVLTRIGYG